MQGGEQGGGHFGGQEGTARWRHVSAQQLENGSYALDCGAGLLGFGHLEAP